MHLVSGKFHATEHALVVYPKQEINAIWLHYLLRSLNLNQYATGSAQPGLSVKTLQSIQCVWVDLTEQEKIAQQITEYENQIAACEQKMLSLPAQKQAILAKYLQ